jgi:prolyl-tRNA synthetase
MKQSRHLGRTLRDVPKEAHTVAHKLMLRAGYIKQLSAGLYTYMPLMTRVLQKISNIVREEHNKRGCEELLMPALQPKELWVESGRWRRYTDLDGIMFAFKDRRESEVCLGPTHEEVITDILRKEVKSYKDLPKIPYQIQTKFRDEIRPRFGLMRAREFIMKDAYSFDRDAQGMSESYLTMREVYNAICQRLGVNYRCVKADSGAIGGDNSEEFMVLAETGEDDVVYCDSCDYGANSERASSRLEEFEQDSQAETMQEVLGEGLIGVEALSKFLKIPVWKTTKTIIFKADNQLVAVMVRGDCEVNSIKVQNYLKVETLELASAEDIKNATGAEVGYAGPIGLPKNIRIIADTYVANRVNFECGANKTNYHNINVNFGRDLPEPEFLELKLAKAGDYCPNCAKGKLAVTRGIEVGHIFQLGTKYSEAMQCTYLDEQDQPHPIFMGCYGIGVSRFAAAVIEQNHDDKGMIWPKNISPYQVHLIGLNLEKPEVKALVDLLYQDLLDSNIEVLYDDRELRAGEKFSDADLMGISIRLTVSARTLENNQAELKFRTAPNHELVEIKDLAEIVSEFYQE